ncbi:MAG TPA: hypothetical protein V6C72_09120 [Chroococcales cyanobacterium]
MIDSIKKGQLLVVKAPPYYDKTYFYEVLSSGGKQIRAALYHSPKVKKSWTADQLKLLLEMGIVRLASEDERPGSPEG